MGIILNLQMKKPSLRLVVHICTGALPGQSASKSRACNDHYAFHAPLGRRVRTATPVRLCGSLARVGLNAAAGRRRPQLPQRLGGGWLRQWRIATTATASLRRARSCGACWILRIRALRGDAEVLELGMRGRCLRVRATVWITGQASAGSSAESVWRGRPSLGERQGPGF